MSRIVTYQVDVDYLGFPVYMEHRISKFSEQPKSKFHKSNSVNHKVVIEQNLIKQH